MVDLGILNGFREHIVWKEKIAPLDSISLLKNIKIICLGIYVFGVDFYVHIGGIWLILA